MAVTPYEYVGKALVLLKAGLAPYVEREISAATKSGALNLNATKKSVVKCLREPPSQWDVAILLRIMWETWRRVFGKKLERAHQYQIGELRGWRNSWAHQATFTYHDAYRVMDSSSRLLTAISATPQIAKIENLQKELLRICFEEEFGNQPPIQEDSEDDTSAVTTENMHAMLKSGITPLLEQLRTVAQQQKNVLNAAKAIHQEKGEASTATESDTSSMAMEDVQAMVESGIAPLLEQFQAIAQQQKKNLGTTKAAHQKKETAPPAAIKAKHRTAQPQTDEKTDQNMPAAKRWHIKIYMDGVCSGNQGAGGWAAILKHGTRERCITGKETHTTHNRMVLTAALAALRELKRPCHISLYTNSTYVEGAFNQRWIEKWQRNGWRTSLKESVANQDLWKELLEAARTHQIRWIKNESTTVTTDLTRANKLALQAHGTSTVGAGRNWQGSINIS